MVVKRNSNAHYHGESFAGCMQSYLEARSKLLPTRLLLTCDWSCQGKQDQLGPSYGLVHSKHQDVVARSLETHAKPSNMHRNLLRRRLNQGSDCTMIAYTLPDVRFQSDIDNAVGWRRLTRLEESRGMMSLSLPVSLTRTSMMGERAPRRGKSSIGGQRGAGHFLMHLAIKSLKG